MFKEIRKTQPLLEKIFPNLKGYPVNSLTPSVIVNKDYEYMVSLLAIASSKQLKEIKNYKETIRAILNIYAKGMQDGQGKTLTIELIFTGISDNLRFVTELPETDTIIQPLIKGLQKVDEIQLWIANERKQVEYVFTTSWNYEEEKTNLQLLEDK